MNRIPSNQCPFGGRVMIRGQQHDFMRPTALAPRPAPLAQSSLNLRMQRATTEQAIALDAGDNFLS